MQCLTKVLLLSVALIAALCSPQTLQAERRAESALDSAIHHHRFVFYAQWAIAYNGARRQLTPPYELLVTSDSIACFLPYTGRMYTVPTPEDLRYMNIRFTSKRFSYRKVTGKRSGWSVRITPEDVRDVRELSFSIARRGWAVLTIRSAVRDRMTYEGVIEPLPK